MSELIEGNSGYIISDYVLNTILTSDADNEIMDSIVYVLEDAPEEKNSTEN